MAFAVPSYFVWLIFILPYAGALVTVALRKAGRLGDYAAAAFAFLSALFAFAMLFPTLEGQTLTRIRLGSLHPPEAKEPKQRMRLVVVND